MTKQFRNTDLGLTIAADDVDVFLSELKKNGLNAGAKQVQALLDGKRDEVQGFYLMEGTVEELVVEEKKAPTAGAADEKNNFSEDAVAAAIAEAQAAGIEVQTTKPTEAPTAAPAAKAKKEIKAVAPKGKVKAVRKDTKIARGLEALLGGVTMEELLAVNVGDDPVDFCMRRVTKRGYGIALADGKVKLVLPEGATAVAYSG